MNFYDENTEDMVVKEILGVGTLFTLAVLDETSEEEQVGLFIEDDESHFLTARFARSWLPDLLATVKRAL